MDYFFSQLQSGAPLEGSPPTTAVIEIPSDSTPIPVSPTATPDSIAVYSIQGAIVAIVLAIGKPVIEKVYLMFSESARVKASKEEKLLNQQLSSAQLLENQYKEQREFLQQLINTQNETHNSNLKDFYSKELDKLDQIIKALDNLADIQNLNKPKRTYKKRVTKNEQNNTSEIQ